MIGADSLGFLSTESLIKAIDIPSGRKVENGGLTVAYFDGKYPTPLYDYEADYLASLKQQEERNFCDESLSRSWC